MEYEESGRPREGSGFPFPIPSPSSLFPKPQSRNPQSKFFIHQSIIMSIIITYLISAIHNKQFRRISFFEYWEGLSKVGGKVEGVVG